jgi:hypothetical protein
MKLLRKLWKGIEVMVEEQMHPDGKYMRKYAEEELD